MEEEEHEVYGGEIPVEGEMDADVDMSVHDDDAVKVAFRSLCFCFSCLRGSQKNQFFVWVVIVYVFQELDEMKKRLKEMEEEAAALREMQAKVEKEMGAVQGCLLWLCIIVFVY